MQMAAMVLAQLIGLLPESTLENHFDRYMLFLLLILFDGPMNTEGNICTDSHLLVSLYGLVFRILLLAKKLDRRENSWVNRWE